MITLHAQPQPLTGAEILTIAQMQSGNMVACSITLAALSAYIGGGTAWDTSLPTIAPTTAGVLWNNGGVISLT